MGAPRCDTVVCVNAGIGFLNQRSSLTEYWLYVEERTKLPLDAERKDVTKEKGGLVVYDHPKESHSDLIAIIENRAT